MPRCLRQNTLLANQTDILAKFNTGFAQHTMTAGLDLIQETRDFARNNFAGQAATNFLFPNPFRWGRYPAGADRVAIDLR